MVRSRESSSRPATDREIKLARIHLERIAEDRQSPAVEAALSEFRRRGWQGLSEDDIDRVLSLDAEPEPEVTASVWEQAFVSFLQGLPSGREIFEATDCLFRCESYDHALGALREIFVDCLGYAERGVEETRRLGGLRSIVRWTRVAEHRGFLVSLVSTPYFYPGASNAHPIFQILPEGVVFFTSPEWRLVWVAYRSGDRAGTSPVRARVLSGSPTFRHDDDDLLTWTWRLAQLRPSYGDAARDIARRTAHAFEAQTSRIAMDWSSGSVSTGGDHCATWSEVGRLARESFLQEGVAPGQRRVCGLESAARTLFPIPLPHSDLRVEWLGYQLTPETPFDGRLTAEGRTWCRRVEVNLRICAPGKPPRAYRLEAGVPCVTDDGRVHLDGQWLRYAPEVDADGLILSTVADPERYQEPDEEDWVTSLDVEAGDAPESAEGEELSEDENGDEPQSVSESEAPAARALWQILETAARRKLYAIAMAVRALEQPTIDEVFATILRRATAMRGRDPVFLLTSKVYLRDRLEPVREDGSPVQRLATLAAGDHAASARPPGWACPDVSADLPVGRWYPVAGARLGPTGDLCVARPDATGSARLAPPRSPVWEVNPRCGGDGLGPLATWIAPRLAPWADRAAGDVEHAAHLEARGVPLALDTLTMVAGPGPRLGVLADARCLPVSRPPVRYLTTTFPDGAVPDSGLRPRLCVRVGQQIAPGDQWLEVPAEMLRSTQTVSGETLSPLWRLVQQVCEDDEGASVPHWAKPEFECWRVPAGFEGVVVDAVLVPVRGWRGAETGWRACVVVAPPTRSDGVAGHLALPDGRVVPIGRFRLEGDAPFDARGRPCDVFVEGVERPVDNREAWTDGRTGEALSGAKRVLPSVGFAFLPLERPDPVGPDPALRRRVRDGEGIPASPMAAGLTAVDRFWLALRHPSSILRLGRAEAIGERAEPPFWSRIRDVGIAIVQPSVAAASRTPSRALFPVATRLRSLEFPPPHVTTARPWQCRCGVLDGVFWAHQTCPACHGNARTDDVESGPSFVLRLPEPVPHPWRGAALAKLLSCSLAGVWRRFRIEGGDVLAARATEAGEERDGRELFLDAISILPPRNMPAGVVPGAGSLAFSPLLARYQRVAQVARRLERFSADGRAPVVLLETARAQLLHAIVGLFGDLDQSATTAEPGTLAELVARVWPGTRASRLRSATPGLFRLPSGVHLEEDAPSFSLSVEHYDIEAASQWFDSSRPVRVESGELRGKVRLVLSLREAPPDAPQVCAIDGDRVGVLPGPPALRMRNERIRSADEWERRVARITIARDLVRALAAMVAPLATANDPAGGGITLEDVFAHRRPEVPREWVRQLGMVVPPEPPTALGWVVGWHLTGALEADASDPRRLVALLRARIPLPLPANPAHAWERVRPALEAAFPGDGPALACARALLARVLLGWWYRTDAVGKDGRWSWSPPTVRPPAPQARRALPPLGSPAWRAWPSFDAVLHPVRWLFERQFTKGLLPVLLAGAMGFPVKPALGDFFDALESQAAHLTAAGSAAAGESPAPPLAPSPPDRPPSRQDERLGAATPAEVGTGMEATVVSAPESDTVGEVLVLEQSIWDWVTRRDGTSA